MEDLLVDRVIQGKVAARHVRDEVLHEVEALQKLGVQPHVCFVRVGDDPASAIYVNAKERACSWVHVASTHIHLPASTTVAELEATIDDLNADDSVDGILIQLPLPPSFPDKQILNRIKPEKDVDGFHPQNLGGVMAGRGPLEPCTPGGVIRLMQLLDLHPRGAHAVVVGRSVVVGRPMTNMLLRADATVTCCHRYTASLEHYVRDAEIVVVAAGVPGLVKGHWFREGAWVFDVGSTRMPDGTIHGDVEYEVALELGRIAGITPVPGGIGPMTIAMLLHNTIVAAKLRRGLMEYTLKRA